MRELSLNVMDIVQNSISAGASEITVEVQENREEEYLAITITDNGKGMSEETVKSVTDPFYTTRTTRSVGLGVPLFKMEAEMTGGSFYIKSKLGEGTELKATFVTNHIDMIPLGDINSTILPLIIGNPEINFIFKRSLKNPSEEKREFSIETREILEVLGEDVPLTTPDVVLWIKGFLEENTEELLNNQN